MGLAVLELGLDPLLFEPLLLRLWRRLLSSSADAEQRPNGDG